jgi:uncharacterized protein YjlB
MPFGKPDFLVVGAYPPAGTYNECMSLEDHARALKRIPKVGRPRRDPVYGSDGPLLEQWRNHSAKPRTGAGLPSK